MCWMERTHSKHTLETLATIASGSGQLQENFLLDFLLRGSVSDWVLKSLDVCVRGTGTAEREKAEPNDPCSL